MAKKRKKPNFGSMLTGFGLGSLVGWYVGKLIQLTAFSVTNPTLFQYQILTLSLFGLLFGGIFAFFAWKRPVLIEYLAYAASIYIIFQFAWDGVVERDIGPERWYMFIHGTIILITNMLTGYVRVFGAKKTAANALGLGVR